MRQLSTDQSKVRVIPLLPYKHVQVATTLTSDTAMKLFKDSISTQYVPPIQLLPSMPPPNVKKLEGDVAKGGFSLRTASNTNGRISPGMAYISGRFIDTKTGVNIDLHAYPGSMTIIIMILGCLLTLGAGIYLALQPKGDYLLLLGGFAVMIIASIGYIIDADTIDLYIYEILQPHLVNTKE